jgi:formylglycine-generating enzyme required for sulfatase activity
VRYENFDLLLDAVDTGYRARVIRSLAGDAVARFGAPTPGGSPEDVGAVLYAAAFGGQVDACFRSSLAAAERLGVGLRIRIRISEEAWELSSLPWESLYLRDLDRFLARSPLTPVVRYLELPEQPRSLAVGPPITVLAVVASPEDQDTLSIDQEWAQLQEALAPLSRSLVLDVLRHATRENLHARLSSGPVHVLHYFGHGYFDDAEGEGGLVLEDIAGASDFVSGRSFKELLADLDEPRLVFLSACEGARSGKTQPLGGVAQRLVQAGVPAVVAMQTPVSEAGSRVLSAAFYRGVAAGLPVEAALGDARRLMAAVDSAEWAVPVLFSRCDDLQLLSIGQPTGPSDFEPKRFEPATVLVPAGAFLMGSDDQASRPNERPQHTVALPDFRIGVCPVTVAQYAEFVQRTKTDPPREGWFLRKPTGKLDHPVTGVSWRQAVEYCRWLSVETGRRYRLPIEAEWEKAARGADGRLLPWGDAWIDGACQAEADDTAPVGAHTAGASPVGCQDMLGNVQEWTNTAWGSRKEQADYGYPYDAGDGREDAPPDPPAPQPLRVHRGGCYSDKRDDLRCSARGASPPESQLRWRGFRVAMDV